MTREEQLLLKSINRAVIKYRGSYALWSRRSGIGYHELLLLYSLRDEEVVSQKLLCDHYLLPKQTVHNVFAAYRRKGYLEQVPGSGKERFFRLSPAGETYAATVLQPMGEAELAILSAMGEERVRLMAELMAEYGSLVEQKLVNEEPN